MLHGVIYDPSHKGNLVSYLKVGQVPVLAAEKYTLPGGGFETGSLIPAR